MCEWDCIQRVLYLITPKILEISNLFRAILSDFFRILKKISKQRQVKNSLKDGQLGTMSFQSEINNKKKKKIKPILPKEIFAGTLQVP